MTLVLIDARLQLFFFTFINKFDAAINFDLCLFIRDVLQSSVTNDDGLIEGAASLGAFTVAPSVARYVTNAAGRHIQVAERIGT